MRELELIESKKISGGWIPLAFSAVRLGYAMYRAYGPAASAATWAARGTATVGFTYQAMNKLDPNKK